MPLGSFHRRFKLATARNEIFRACGTDPWWKSLYCITWNNFPTYRGRARINSEIVRITGGRDRVWLKSRTARTHSCAFFDCRSNFEPSTLFFVLVITVGASLREHTTRWRRVSYSLALHTVPDIGPDVNQLFEGVGLYGTDRVDG